MAKTRSAGAVLLHLPNPESQVLQVADGGLDLSGEECLATQVFFRRDSMKWLAIVLAALAVVMLWQHVRYLRARRDIVQDRQPMLHSSDTFHVITFLDVAQGEDVIEAVRKVRQLLEASGAAQLIYAGQAAFTMASSQLGPRSWDAVLLLQYPSRASYDQAARSAGHRDALAAFEQTYSHGMQRHWLVNLGLQQVLLALSFVDVVTGHLHVPPLVAMPESEMSGQQLEIKARVADLLRLRSVNDEALVIFNLIQPGTREQRAADASYGRKMLTRMARLAHGPMHMGSSVTVEGDATFETVVIVYYPGVSYFAELLSSRFFLEIIGDKQLGDTQAVPTVPILSRL